MNNRATRNFGKAGTPKNPVGTMTQVKAPINMPHIRKIAKGILGDYNTEVKAREGLIYYLGTKGGGYAIDLRKYPEVADKTLGSYPIDGILWGFVGDKVSYCRLIWLYPDIINNLKKNTSELKQFRVMSKADYRQMCLTQTRETLEKEDPAFLEKYPQYGMGKED